MPEKSETPTSTVYDKISAGLMFAGGVMGFVKGFFDPPSLIGSSVAELDSDSVPPEFED